MTQKIEEKQAEIQEEGQEGMTPLIEEILENTLSIFDPLEVKDHAGNIVAVTKEQFSKYYMPRNASEDERFHCYQAVRATGLSLFAPGECYFFKTGDGPIKLFTGYMAYLRKAYAAGLEHIEKPAIEFGDDPDGYPTSCTITIRIKDRESMEWPTRFSEVAGTSRGELNSRWKKAPIQMLIKCAIVNILRLSGLVDFTMPYTVDEVPDPVVPGYRTLTQSQLDANTEQEGEQEASVGEVSAENHQVDMKSRRMKFFGLLKDLGMSFTTDEARRHFQKQDLEIPGNGSLNNLTVETWPDVFVKLGAMKAKRLEAATDNAKAEPESTEEQGEPDDAQAVVDTVVEEATEQMKEGAKQSLKEQFLGMAATVFPDIIERQKWYSENITEDVGEIPTDQMLEHGIELLSKTGSPFQKTQEAEEEEQDDTKEPAQQPESVPMTKEMLQAMRDMLADFPEKKYKTMRSMIFRTRCAEILGREVPTFTNCDEREAQKILAALQEEKNEIAFQALGADNPGPVVTKETVAGEIVDDDPLGQEAPDLTEEELLTEPIDGLSPEDAQKEHESQEAFSNQQEAKELMGIYLTKADDRFANKGERQSWEQTNKLPPVPPSAWKPEEIKTGIALLGGVTPMADVPAANGGKMLQEQFDRIKTAAEKLPYANIGSIKFRARVSEILEVRYSSLRKFSVEQASDLVNEFEDEVQDFENKRGRYGPKVI